jgi:hypothetical protein
MFENARTNTSNNPSELYLHLQQCKLLGRTIKSQRPLSCLTVSDYKSTIPTKEVCDELVANYFRNFESIYRIIHIPSFYASYADYWVSPDENNCCLSMVLVLASARCSYQTLQKPHLFVPLHANGHMLPNNGSQPPLKSSA